MLWAVVLALFSMIAFNAMVESSIGNRKWRDLTEEEIKVWYSPIDLCVLESSNRFTSAQEIRRNCSWLGARGWRGCAVGMGSNNFPCYPPFATARQSFLRGVEGYTNHSHTPLLNAIKSLTASNGALVLLGDSTMRQKLAAIRCEMLREHGRAWIEGNLRGILPCHTNLTIHFPDDKGGEYALRVHGVSVGPNSVNCLRGGLGKRHLKGIYENAESVIKRINEEDGQSAAILANLGLWYNDDTLFRRVVPDVLEWLHNVTQSGPPGGPKQSKNTVRWHETMAQHWENDYGSGYYYRPASEAKERLWAEKGIGEDRYPTEDFQVPTCCTPITNTSYGNDWRNEIIVQHLASMREAGKGKQVSVVPFADVTNPATDLHVCHPTYKFDCTHYCYTPLLWQPMHYDIEGMSLFHAEQFARLA